MDSQSKEAQGQGIKKLAKQHLTKKTGRGGATRYRFKARTVIFGEIPNLQCENAPLLTQWERTNRPNLFVYGTTGSTCAVHCTVVLPY
eukprot:COSAG02_NODE_1488_length_12368_cov_23.731926_4_plen_88_part_00